MYCEVEEMNALMSMFQYNVVFCILEFDFNSYSLSASKFVYCEVV